MIPGLEDRLMQEGAEEEAVLIAEKVFAARFYVLRFGLTL